MRTIPRRLSLWAAGIVALCLSSLVFGPSAAGIAPVRTPPITSALDADKIAARLALELRIVAPARIQSVDHVISMYYAAIGGYEALKAVKSRRMRGIYTEGTLRATTDIAWARPAQRRVNVHAPGFEYSEGFDGSTWEYDFQAKSFKRDSGAAADAGRRGAEFDESFVDYRAKGHRVVLLGVDSVRARETFHLRVTLADGWVKEYYFDTKTHLIVALRKAMPIHARGPVVASLSYYEDWRRTGTLIQPYALVEREATSGRLMTTLQWDVIESNPVLLQSELQPPTQE
ncbi:MAG TPA: hypothetical protein VFQ05_05690 [Candidatus Eisenbacteria bacterium]|nr:hypothetical protein [Candidatus Eisenbacteria bacterium]